MVTSSAEKGHATRQALIEVAEQLFGEHGVKGVSLREIASAAGAGNTSAVAYHFGDKDGLVYAIFEQRLADLERRRADLFNKALREGRGDDLQVLAHALYLPLAEQTNSKGKHSYAAFMAGLLRMDEFSLRREQTAAAASVGDELAVRIRRLLPTPNAEAAYLRQRLVTLFVCDSLMLLDSMASMHSKNDYSCAVREVLSMAVAALEAPV